MKNINNEKDLEFYYRKFFEEHLGIETTAINNTDGVFEYKGTKVLIEIKFKVPFNKENISRTLAQAIYYCKRFEFNLDIVPSIILIGNEDEFVCFGYDEYEHFLRDDSIDWLIPPSTIFQSKNNLLVKKIKQNVKSFKKKSIDELIEFVNYLKKYCRKNSSKIVVYKGSFIDLYKKFSELFKNCNPKMVNLAFFTYLLCNDKVKKKENDVVENIVTGLSWRKFESFFNRYDLSNLKKEDLISFYDIMKDNDTRILSGSFYTPPYIARIAIEAMKTYIDKDFMKKYVVWDPACGTGNLTKDFEFKHLYLSTIDDLELKLIEYAGVNPSAMKFKYDFVSEMDTSFIYKEGYEKLREALEKGNLIFYMNPPFVGFDGPGFSLRDGERNNWQKNIVYNKLKKVCKIKSCDSTILFLYKILNIAKSAQKNVYVCFFSNPSTFLRFGKHKFSRMFFKNFKHIYSLLFNSEDFGVTEGWEIQFSIFKYEPSKKFREVMFSGHKIWFNRLKDVSKIEKYILKNNVDETFICSCKKSRTKLIYKNSKKIICDDFLFILNDFRAPIGLLTNKNYIDLTSMAYECNTKNYWKAMIYCGVTSYFVYPYSMIRTRYPRTRNLNIFDKKKFIEHVLDCTVLTIFDKTSLKPIRNTNDIEIQPVVNEVGWNGTFRYRKGKWNFINHMFPWNTESIKEKSDKYNFNLVKEDCILNYGYRYTYTKLKKFEKYLSNEARRVLMRAAKVYLNLIKNHDEEFFKDGFDNVKLKKYDKRLVRLLSKLGKKVYEDSQKFKTLV